MSQRASPSSKVRGAYSMRPCAGVNSRNSAIAAFISLRICEAMEVSQVRRSGPVTRTIPRDEAVYTTHQGFVLPGGTVAARGFAARGWGRRNGPPRPRRAAGGKAPLTESRGLRGVRSGPVRSQAGSDLSKDSVTEETFHTKEPTPPGERGRL